MVLKGKWAGSHGGTTIFNHQVLNEAGGNNDPDEEEVVEETVENVVLKLAELAGVDLIEDLHEHE